MEYGERPTFTVIETGYATLAMRSTVAWSALALVSILTATPLLRYTYLRRAGGKSKIARRRRRIPPVGNDPIRWKELYIEADKDFGRLARTIGRLALFLMVGSSLLLLALFNWSTWDTQCPEFVRTTLSIASLWLGTLVIPMSWLVQWAVGIRAADGDVASIIDDLEAIAGFIQLTAAGQVPDWCSIIIGANEPHI